MAHRYYIELMNAREATFPECVAAGNLHRYHLHRYSKLAPHGVTKLEYFTLRIKI